MRGTIKLDDEAALKTCKIGDIGPDRVLPPEFQTAELAGTQALPKPELRFGH